MSTMNTENTSSSEKAAATPPLKVEEVPPALPKEFGGQKGPEPTRFGDWENKGRCTDF